MTSYEQNIVIDLEFNPVSGDPANSLRNEICEIGAVRLDRKGSIVDTFSSLVKPDYSETIAKHITRLTGLRTSDVSHAENLETVLSEFCAWVGDMPTRIVAWSGSDQDQLSKECACKGIEFPGRLKRWMDLQKVYPRVLGVGGKKHMKLADAVAWYGAEIDAEKSHRALYDATATAALMSQLLNGSVEEHCIALQNFIVKSDSAHSSLSSNLGQARTELALLKERLEAREKSAA